MFNDDFMDFMGYRNSVVEDKIQECMDQVRQGNYDIEIPRGDLTDSEVEYVQREVQRRYDKGRY